MKFEDQRSSASNARAAYSVQPPRPLSLLWALEWLASLSVPIAIIGVVTAARGLGLVTLY
jgi:hypothetical protein